jgi:MFS family permease
VDQEHSFLTLFQVSWLTAAGGSIIGGLSAGLFALAWWPWTFWSHAIVLAVIVVVSSFVLPDPAPKVRRSLRQKLQLLDLPGAAVGVTALVLFNFAWNQAPIVGWEKAYVYVLLIIGLLLVPVFFYMEFRLSAAPLLPVEALTVDVGFVIGGIACGWSSFGKSPPEIRCRPKLTRQASLSFTLSAFSKTSEARRLCWPSPTCVRWPSRARARRSPRD